MRRPVFLVYALLFVNEIQQAGIIPLLPTFKEIFGLTKVETGAILSMTTFATVVVAVPVGLLADRVGARVLTVGAGCLLVVAPLMQAFADGIWPFLAGRALFGIAYGTVWTAGLASIRDSTSTRRASALGGTVTVGGLAYLTSPPFAGFTAQHFGVRTPFFVFSGLALAVTAALVLWPAPRATERTRQRLLPALRAARGAHVVRSAIVLIAMLGSVMGVIQLLVPLRLGQNGLSPGEIGAAFSASSALWILVSASTARLGERAARLPVAGAGVLLLGLAFILPITTLSTAALIAFLLVRSGFGAPLSTISYPLSEAGSRTVDIGAGTVIAFMNVAWGAAAVSGPLLGGVLAQSIGERWTFGAVLGCCLAVGTWILVADRRAAQTVAAADAR